MPPDLRPQAFRTLVGPATRSAPSPVLCPSHRPFRSANRPHLHPLLVVVSLVVVLLVVVLLAAVLPVAAHLVVPEVRPALRLAPHRFLVHRLPATMSRDFLLCCLGSWVKVSVTLSLVRLPFRQPAVAILGLAFATPKSLTAKTPSNSGRSFFKESSISTTVPTRSALTLTKSTT